MYFIGIVADCKDFEFIKKELIKKNNPIQLIQINKKTINNIKNIKFDSIVVCTQLDKLERQDIFNYIIKNCKYLIINSDLKLNNSIIKNDKIKTITYGLNQKATVTVSSITEDRVMACLQRNIEDINNNIIEVQEFIIEDHNITNKKIYSMLVVLIIQQLYNCKK